MIVKRLIGLLILVAMAGCNPKQERPTPWSRLEPGQEMLVQHVWPDGTHDEAVSLFLLKESSSRGSVKLPHHARVVVKSDADDPGDHLKMIRNVTVTIFEGLNGGTDVLAMRGELIVPK